MGPPSQDDLTELLDASWILTAPHSWVYLSVAEAFQARGARHAEDRLGGAFRAPSYQLACHGSFCHGLAEFGATPQCWPALAESIADRFANPGIPCRNLDAKESSLEPAGRVLHQACSRSRQTDGRGEASRYVVNYAQSVTASKSNGPCPVVRIGSCVTSNAGPHGAA
jgi:hypothetical protein